MGPIYCISLIVSSTKGNALLVQAVKCEFHDILRLSSVQQVFCFLFFSVRKPKAVKLDLAVCSSKLNLCNTPTYHSTQTLNKLPAIKLSLR